MMTSPARRFTNCLRYIFTLLLTGTVLAAQSELDQRLIEPVPDATDEASRKIITTHLKAVGGERAIARVWSVRMQLDITTRKVPTQMEMAVMRPDSFYIKLETERKGEPVLITSGFDGEQAWIYDQSQKNAFPRETERESIRSEFEQPIVTPLYGWDERPDIYEYLGPVKSNGRECYLVKAYSPEGLTTYYYFDAKTLLLTREGRRELIKDIVVDRDNHVTAYENIDGLWMPTVMEQHMNDEKIGTIKMTSIELNPSDLDLRLFSVPVVEERWLRQSP
ncbi:MAG: hypothetical protein AAGA45_02930 [Verrucomicrobiota bacterium]